MKYFLAILLFFQILLTTAQELKPLAITGVILDMENRAPIPSVNIQIKGTVFGTSSDINGHFTLIIQRTDTLVFTSVGYEKSYFTLDAKLQKSQYTLVQLMIRNTLQLDEVDIFPWPDWKDFEKAFLQNTDQKRTIDWNLEVTKTLESVSEKEYETNKFMYDQMRYQRLYDLNGIVPPNNFLNPVNWTNFIYELQKSQSKK